MAITKEQLEELRELCEEHQNTDWATRLIDATATELEALRAEVASLKTDQKARAEDRGALKDRESRAITEREYYEEIQSIATETRNECEGDSERERDRVHETIDGHQWVLYNHYHLQVLWHSRNEDAHFEYFGSDFGDAKCLSDITVKLVYMAMVRDVDEALAELPEYEAPAED